MTTRRAAHRWWQPAQLAGSGGDASRIPASRAEMKAAEMAGIDLANKDERAGGNATRRAPEQEG